MVSLPPRERGGIRAVGGAVRRLMVSLPPRKRGGIRAMGGAVRRLVVSLPPRERGGIRAVSNDSGSWNTQQIRDGRKGAGQGSL